MSLSILAVDDSRTIRDMLRLTLTEAGMDVTTADDGLHGLVVLEEMRPDAIISDVNMPRMDGFQFIEAVRRIDRLRAVPVLMLTTESAPELKARARNCGATGWIVKPFDPQKLVSSLQMITG
ncbi:two-component system, chemotaxis family, response regulator CheY [Paracoccus isoporae]|uniref:Two-component system, chemotaxis family, response regulator CheY n=1 Tax=Paracoccus isoporae TaxID=591205 RepID=A0A1G6WEC1_9RHOB|nr:response regulator [Paracoccus isoporae]SDD63597.1 two-component system, chemotaxis family, response regulator CheY [Paracoccus isoporae]